MASDSEIMQRIQAGEAALFSELVARYQNRLLRFAISKTPNHATAEDLVQEAFLAAFRSRMSYSTEYAVSTWLWSILLNLSKRDARRQQRRRGIEAARIDSPMQSATDPISLLIQAERRALVHDLLDEIHPRQADALRLRFFGELSFDEIALTMQCSVSGAKRRVKNGLLNLAQVIQRRDWTQP